MLRSTCLPMAIAVLSMRKHISQAADKCPEHVQARISVRSETLDDYDFQSKYGYSKKGKIFPQIQQQQQQIQQSILNSNIPLPEPEPAEPPKKPEKIWYLIIPASTQLLKIVRAQGSTGNFDITEWDRRTIINGSDVDRDRIKIDVTKSLAPTAGEWYLICVNLKTVEKNSVGSCDACAVEAADSHGDAVSGKIVDFTQTRVLISYTVGDWLLPETSIRTIAKPVSKLQRCFDHKPKAVISEDLIQPFSTVDVVLEIDPAFGYSIEYELALAESNLTKAMGVDPNVVSSSHARGSFSVPESCEGKAQFLVSGL